MVPGEVPCFMYENLIASLAAGFVDVMPEEADAGVRSALGETGKAFEADRSFVRVFRGDPPGAPSGASECGDARPQ